MLDRAEYLVDVLTFEELEVRVKTVDMLKEDGTIDRLLYPEDIVTLQEFIGYCLIPCNNAHVR